MEVKVKTVAEQGRSVTDTENDSAEPTRVAILSLLFNWPSTGGGNHHTAEMARFLALAGYEVKHFFAEYPAGGSAESPTH